MVTFKAPDNHKILLIKFFFFAEQTEVSGAFERGDWGLFDVLWLHGFSLVWFYEVRGGKKKCWLEFSVFYLLSWVIVMAFQAEILWHQMKTVYFTQASTSDKGKSSNFTSWIKCKQKCDKIQPEEQILKILIITQIQFL